MQRPACSLVVASGLTGAQSVCAAAEAAPAPANGGETPPRVCAIAIRLVIHPADIDELLESQIRMVTQAAHAVGQAVRAQHDRNFVQGNHDIDRPVTKDCLDALGERYA